MTASINEWAAPFLDGSRKFYYSEDFLLVYDNASGEFGVASTDAKLLYQGDNKFYLTNNFERHLTKFWNSSNVHDSTRIELYYSKRILWFAKEVCYGLHVFYRIYCRSKKRVSFKRCCEKFSFYIFRG